MAYEWMDDCDTEQEHRDFHYATDTELDNAAASEIGAGCPEHAWVLTDRDVWHANPYYTGPAVPHPEDDEAHDLIAAGGVWTPHPTPKPGGEQFPDFYDDLPF